MRSFMKKLSALTLVLLGLTLAQSFPQRVDTYVNDFAGILSAQEAAEIRQLFDQHNKQNGIEVVLVTLPSLAEYGAGGVSIENYALSLFNLWAIGDWQRDDGILLLFAEGDREVRIQLGASYTDAAERQAAQVIETMLPSFQEGDYSAGLLAGARGLLQIGRSPVRPLPRQPQANPGTATSWLNQNWFWVALIVAFLLLVVFPIIGSSRRRSASSPFMSQGLGMPAAPLFPTEERPTSRSGSSRGGGRSTGSGASGSWSSSSHRSSSSSSSFRSSSSSSSPSRGGGHSGGRGASGKW